MPEDEIKEEMEKPEKKTPAKTPTKGKGMATKKTDGEGKELRGLQIPAESLADLRRIKAHLELDKGESYSLGAACAFAITETLERLEE